MINKVILIGNVGQDPEIKHINDTFSTAKFSLATSESWKDKSTGERQSKTEWHKVEVTNSGLINIVEKYVKKGDKLYIEGKLQTDSYDKDGETKYITKIALGFGGVLKMLSNKGESTSRGASAGSVQEAASYKDITDGRENARNVTIGASDLDDEIPF